MSLRIESRDRSVTAYLTGEIDHHIAAAIRNDIDYSVRDTGAVELILDFSGVTFMDSSGIGLVMGRYRLMNEMGGSVIVQDPPHNIKKVMKLSGIDRLAEIRNSTEEESK